MQKQHNILVYGFSIFSMFFGSGNLVFPLQIGIETGQHWLAGFLGLFLSGIILPFLGLFVIKIHKGDYYSFFGEAGTIARSVLPLFTLSLLGSFGVVPRCIAVAHGGLEYVLPGLSLLTFSCIFCSVCYLMCLNDKFMISILGRWLTPLLLISLSFLLILAIMKAPKIQVTADLGYIQSLAIGFKQGYETMDLFAAFFFSSLIFKQIQSLMPVDTTHKELVKFAIKPSLIGACLLAITYLGFVFLGSHYNSIFKNITPELFLSTITSYLLGDKAASLVGLIVILSCLTTAVALNNIYARYLCLNLRLGEKKFPIVLLLTTLVSFGISLLDFKGIAKFLSPILENSYPSLIALTLLSIFIKGNNGLKKILFYGIIVVVLVT